MTARYNEIDPYAAQWLRNLIANDLIAPGVVDERPIHDVKPYELAPYAQCHFFAGIGGWSLACRLAGIPDDRPLWTGSCPCQPFSAAGKAGGFDDERHLWPFWQHLIAQRKPPTILGEQVASAIGHGWLDLVFSDLEGEGYACGAAVLPACSVGAPHIRRRLWFVADAEVERGGRQQCLPETPEWNDRAELDGSGPPSKLADSATSRRREERQDGGRLDARDGAQGRSAGFEPGGSSRELAHCDDERLEVEREQSAWGQRPAAERGGTAVGALANSDGGHTCAERLQCGGQQRQQPQDGGVSSWSNLEWLPCTDGKARPTKPGIFPLAHGVSARVGKLRAAGNAIVPQVAAEFIRACVHPI